MASSLGHHHQNPRRAFAPPKTGTVHLRPPDDVVSGSESSQEDQPVTRSPSTRRVVKRSRVRPSIDLIAYADADPAPTPPRDDLAPTLEEELEEELAGLGQPLAFLWSDDQAPLLSALAAILTRAVATLDALEMEGEDASNPPYPGNLQVLADGLYRRILRDSIALGYYEYPVRSALGTTYHGSPAHKGTQATEDCFCSSSATRASVSLLPSSPHPPLDRLPPEIDQRAPVTALASILDDATYERHAPPHIRGVNWTSNGNLVIHTRAPYTASQLAAVHGKDVISIVQRECGEFQGPAVLEVDAPWVQVVVHGIPAQPLAASMKFQQEDFWTALETMGNTRAEVKAVRVLCREEDLEMRDKLSLRLTFSDVGAARRMLASGAFLFGTHCRVSRYRPRQKSTPPL
ncbi:hypothetical protein B0H13DRAFT_2305856 [Mycena leptocephala]|nr:hypothetical protein B0H13DRAFT_2305856 [Mycena leptocephala]